MSNLTALDMNGPDMTTLSWSCCALVACVNGENATIAAVARTSARLIQKTRVFRFNFRNNTPDSFMIDPSKQ